MDSNCLMRWNHYLHWFWNGSPVFWNKFHNYYHLYFLLVEFCSQLTLVIYWWRSPSNSIRCIPRFLLFFSIELGSVAPEVNEFLVYAVNNTCSLHRNILGTWTTLCAWLKIIQLNNMILLDRTTYIASWSFFKLNRCFFSLFPTRWSRHLVWTV